MAADLNNVAPGWHMPREPVFYAALAYAAGILVGERYWRPISWWIFAAVFGAVAALFLARSTRHHWAAGRSRPFLAIQHALPRAIITLAFVALGAFGIRARNASVIRPDLGRITDGSEVIVTGYVTKDGVIRGAGSQRRESVDVQIETAELEASEAESNPAKHEPAVPEESLTSHQETQASRRAERIARAIDTRRRRAACKANSVWSPELLRASGIAACGEVESSKREVKGHKSDAVRYAREYARADAPETSLLRTPAKVVLTQQAAIRLTIYSRERRDESDDEDEGGLPRAFTYGQRIRFATKLRPPRNFGNPGALDYEGYLAQMGIYALGSTRLDRVEVLSGLGGSRWGSWASRVRRSIVGKIHALWPENEASLLDAMVIGESSFVGREVKTDFQRTGIYHILVVSGMNVAILAAVVFWILNRLRCPEFVAVVVTFVLSCGYAYIAEAGVPIMRPVIMLGIFMCARLFYRDRAMLNALGTAALCLLVYDPAELRGASFQLTFISVLAIVGIAVPIMERTSGPYKRALEHLAVVAKDASLAPRLAQFRIELRMIADRLAWLLPLRPESFRGIPSEMLRKRIAQRALTGVLSAILSVYDLAVVSTVAQITLTLPMAFYFHRVTVMSLPANLIAVPLVSVLMPASVTAIAVAYVWRPLAYVPAKVTGWAVGGITRAVYVFGGLHSANLRVASPEAMQAVAVATAVAIALALIRRNRLLAGAGLCGLVATTVWIAAIGPRAQVRPFVLEVTSIDVGQADSTLVVTPEGKTVLVDAGGSLGPFQSEFDFGEDVVSPYLWARGISHLDAICLTHAHSDHFGGMRAVIANFHPKELWMGPTPDIPEIQALLKQAHDAGMRVIRHSAQDEFKFGGASVRALSPPSGAEPGKNRNNDSLVLRFSYGQTSALLEGDAEKQMEEIMATWVPHADLIRIAHNGSKTSTIPEFLEAVHPEYAAISVGTRNSFGHPRHEILERLAETGISTYRTDMLGALTFYLDGRRVTPASRR